MTTTDTKTTLEFPAGIPGLPGTTSFVLEPMSETPSEDSLFEVLRATDNSVSLIVTQPWTFFPEYAPDLADDDLAEIGIEKPEDVAIFCSVTLDQAQGCIYVNLLGPFVVNAATHVGRQFVLGDTDWPLRARVDISQGAGTS